MPLWPDLSQRSDEPEIMDAFDSDRQQYVRTLENLQTINRILTPCRRLMKRCFLPAMRRQPARKWRLLDIGAGGCDLPIWFVEKCQRLNIDIQFTCLDYDPRAIEFAEERCRDQPNIEIIQADALKLQELDRQWDFIFANLFLHHLTNEQIVRLLKSIHQVCTEQYVLSDIHRCWTNYIGYTTFALLFLRKDSFSFYDGRLSIRKGFRRREFEQLIDKAGLARDATVWRTVPGHLAIVRR